MARNDLIGKRVAILATDGVEAAELIDPRNALDTAGAKTLLVSAKDDKVKTWEHDHWGDDNPVTTICRGPWMLVEADVVRNRTVTSWPSLQTDLRNAGADWVDREVVTDMGS